MLASRLSRIARIARIARHVAARSSSRRCAPPARRDLFLMDYYEGQERKRKLEEEFEKCEDRICADKDTRRSLRQKLKEYESEGSEEEDETDSESDGDESESGEEESDSDRYSDASSAQLSCYSNPLCRRPEVHAEGL